MPDFIRLREDYKRAALDEGAADPDMYTQFRQWFDQAVSSGLREPNAMALATASPHGIPGVRIVLLKGVDPRGFTFYTNYTSAKAADLAANPRAALLFYWHELERQVRIDGTVEKVEARESDEYFSSRPRASRMSAIASPQSQVIPDRLWLERRLVGIEEQHAGAPDPPRPEHWGGYRVIPEAVEFWQGRPNRLHDRIRYQRTSENEWRIERLAP